MLSQPLKWSMNIKYYFEDVIYLYWTFFICRSPTGTGVKHLTIITHFLLMIIGICFTNLKVCRIYQN